MAFVGPRLRRDLVSTILQEDGVRCVDVRDPKRGSSFRLFDYEYSVALAFDGRPLAKVIPWVRLSTGLTLTAEQLTEFATQLEQLGFLESGENRTPGIASDATPEPVTPAPFEATPMPTPSPDWALPLLTPEPEPEPQPEPLPDQEAPPEPEPTPAPQPELPPQPLLDQGPEAPPAPQPELPPEPEALVDQEPPPAPEPELPPEPEALPDQEPTPAPEPELPPQSLVDQEPPPAPQPELPPQPELTPVLRSESPPEPLPDQEPPPALPPPADPEPTPPPPLASEPTPPPELPPAPPLPTEPAPPPAPSPMPEPPPAIRMLTPGPRRTATPPPIPAAAAHFTPAPLRSAKVRGGPWILYALLGTVAALAVGVLAMPLALSPHAPAAVRARVVVAKPTTLLRWFDGTALVEPLPSQVLPFPAGGKVIRLASPGIVQRPDDVLAATDAAASVLADLGRLQERLANFERLAEALRTTGEERQTRAAQAKVEMNAGLVEQARKASANLAVVAQAPGQVEATLAAVGRIVQAGAPAVRFRPAGTRSSFELPRAAATRLRKQGWCAVEIAGQPVECSLSLDGGDETHVVITLAPEGAAVGQPVRLARARFTDVFVVPASVLSHVGASDRVLVVTPTGRAEARNVTVADRTPADAVITQGLGAGDAVIVETSEPIGPGARVRIAGGLPE